MGPRLILEFPGQLGFREFLAWLELASADGLNDPVQRFACEGKPGDGSEHQPARSGRSVAGRTKSKAMTNTLPMKPIQLLIGIQSTAWGCTLAQRRQPGERSRARSVAADFGAGSAALTPGLSAAGSSSRTGSNWNWSAMFMRRNRTMRNWNARECSCSSRSASRSSRCRKPAAARASRGMPICARQRAKPRRAARMVGVGVGHHDQLDIGEGQSVPGKHPPDLAFRSGDAGIDQDAALRASDQVRVDHAERQDRESG